MVNFVMKVSWFMYYGIFTVGVAVTRPVSNNQLNFDNAIADYSFITAMSGTSINAMIARCLTGLGPGSTQNNGDLGGLYFNGSMIPNMAVEFCGSTVIQVRPGGTFAGITNIHQCRQFSIAVEGIYICTMRNSSMMNQSVRFGIYFSGRCELLDLHLPSLDHLSSLYTAAPVIDPILPNTMTIYVGESLTLSCISRGSPPDTFTWRKDNGPVLQSTTTPVTYNANSAVFRADFSIDSVTTNDSGTYTCTITNPIGMHNATITVTVISKL